MHSLLALALGFWLSAPVSSASSPITHAILVDKKTNLLHVTQYDEGTYKILKTYHATLGQVKGDKEDERDLKTPEGIYTFTQRLTPPALAAKFGKLAFPVNFPNTFDQIAGRTGYGIMLHATNEPDRLKKKYDSEGCVVVRDEEIAEIQTYIRLGLTPILIFAELGDLKSEYMNPGKDRALVGFFQEWVGAWEKKNIDTYMKHYHSDFSAQGMDRTGWRSHKNRLNGLYESIEVRPEDIHYYRHPKYSMVTFTQNYRSRLKGGGWGHRSRGTKILYVAEEVGEPKIIAETYSPLMW